MCLYELFRLNLESITIPKNVSKIVGGFDRCRALSNVYCFAEDVPEGSLGYYLSYENSTLHVPASSIEKYKNAPTWNIFGNIVALTDEELAIYGDDTPEIELSNSIEGIYMTQPDSYRINKGINQPYGNSYEITIVDNGDGTYYINDLLGGWYSQRAGYGPNYSMTGNIEITPNGMVSLRDSYVKGWGDSLAGLTGTYDSERKSFTIEEDYVEGMHFYQTWVKVSDVFVVDGIIYCINHDNTVSVKNGNYSGDIRIPNEVSHNGFTYQVTSVEGAFSGNTSLRSVSLPNTVKSISGAFNGCTALKSVNIPNSVTTIEKNDFLNCTSLETVDIPNSVTSIGDHAFQECSGLTTVNIPSSVISIGYMAFFYCNSLTELTLPDNLTTIGGSSFVACNGLKKLNIPKTVLEIGEWAFTVCENLESIKVESDNLKYDSRGDCNAIIKTYTNELILGCKNTVIPQDVTTITNNAFAGVVGIKTLDIPNSVKIIDDGAYWQCTGLKDIMVGNNVEIIGRGVFHECSGLQSVVVPPTVNKIGWLSFCECPELKDFYSYAKSIPSTDAEAFKDTPIENATLHVPANLVDTYKYTAPWSGFGNIVALTDNDPKPGGMKFGDINGDGVVNAADIVSVINIINKGATEADISIADLNRDGKVDKDDVEEIIKVIMANK